MFEDVMLCYGDHMLIAVGDTLPSFSLLDAQGTIYTTDSLRGRPFVFVFYPGDMTPGCTIQLCQLRDNWDVFTKADVLIFGVNSGSAKSHRAFAESYQLPFPLLIDEDKKLAKAIGATRCLFGFCLTKRVVVGVDAGGIVRYVRTGMPKAAEILKGMKK